MKTLLLSVSFFLLTLPVLADDCVNCSSELKPFGDFTQKVKALDATLEINCDEKLKDEAKKEYLSNFGNRPQTQSVIKGIRLTGTSEELKFFEKMLSKKPTDQWSKAQACKTVLCALTNIYDSEETAYRVLNIAKRDGYIISASKDWNFNDKDLGQLFTPGEIRKIDLAYKLVPPSYKKLSSLDRIKRLPSGHSSPRAPIAAAYASPAYHSQRFPEFDTEGEITFLDDGIKGDSWAPMTAVHELTHHVDYSRSKDVRYGISESPAYLQLSGWKKNVSYKTDGGSGKKVKSEDWTHAVDKKFVTDYAATEPAEDFAESAATYVYAPNKLKALDPEKYDFLKKNVFQNKEYNSELESQISNKNLLQSCIDGKKEFSLGYFYLSEPVSLSCLDGYFKDFKVIDPNLCRFNKEQIKNYIFDSISESTTHLNEFIKKCDASYGTMVKECINDGDFQSNCPLNKFFSDNKLSASKLHLSEEETSDLQKKIMEKIHPAMILERDKLIVKSIETKLGKTTLLSTILLGGLSEPRRINETFPLTLQAYFLEDGAGSLLKKLETNNFKFDSAVDFQNKLESRIMYEKDLEGPIKNFQELVLKKATRSKEKNLELVKSWAASESLEDSPMFEELANSIRKYSSFFNWK